MTDSIRLNLLKSSSRRVESAADRLYPSVSGRAGSGNALPELVVDATGRVIDASESAAVLFGYERVALIVLHVSDLVARLDDSVLDLLIKSESCGKAIVLDALCFRREGGTFRAELALRRVEAAGDGGRLIHLDVEEIQERPDGDETSSQVEARIARAERLEMAGTLAGQIAHDFNNLLTPLLAYPDLIKREIKDNPTVAEYLDIMERTASDMSRLTQQLLSLSRRGHIGNEVFGINEITEQAIALFQSVLPRDIALDIDLAENLLAVKGSRDQIRRVIENLLQNALDAMTEGGRLCVRTENVYLDSPVGQYGAVNVGEYVKISVADSGAGIPDEIKDRIFDPFFTTKRGAKKRGSGLGLSIVHGIVRDHRGYVDLESTVGKGSTFYIYLPIFREEIKKQSGENLPHGTERILVVDDDALQLRVLVQILEALGYTVSGVQSGEEAHRLFREGHRYDLVVLDMVMERGWDGLETFKALRRIVPAQRVVLISGFTKAARNIAQAQQLGAGAYLRKPLTIERVAMVVRSELDAGGPAAADAARSTQRILIADDEAMIRKLFGMIVQTEFPDAVIDHAANGNEAVQAFRVGRHDVVVMDLQMPERDGRQAFADIALLCEKEGWRLPPTIFCTGFAPPESLKSILDSGDVHCLLRKPVKADVLLDAIRRRLKPL